MYRLRVDIKSYIVALLQVALLTMAEVAYARTLDDEMKGLVVGAWISISLLSIMAGALRTVQNLNKEQGVEKESHEIWKPLLSNSFVGFICGWFIYLSMAKTLPVEGVVAQVALAGYAPSWVIEKLFANFKKGVEK